MTYKVIQDNEACILYDNAVSDTFNPLWFEAQGNQLAGGRGAVIFFKADDKEYVLKHYARGGLPAKITKDKYIYLRSRKTRSFAEWNILDHLYQQKLPVPMPIAAQYRRQGAVYTADLITRSCRPAIPLDHILLSRAISHGTWGSIGSVIRQFHRSGLRHPDINLSNILLDEKTGHITLLDFDKATMTKWPSRWKQQRNLQRLQRSMKKLKRQNPSVHLAEDAFQTVLSAWQEA